MKPTIGRIVHYKLSAADVLEINRRRSDFSSADPGHTGFQGHVGNHVDTGQVYPATVVRVFDPNGDTGTCNLQVWLDGNDTFWATSRKTGEDEGTWAWPPRV